MNLDGGVGDRPPAAAPPSATMEPEEKGERESEKAGVGKCWVLVFGEKRRESWGLW